MRERWVVRKEFLARGQRWRLSVVVIRAKGMERGETERVEGTKISEEVKRKNDEENKFAD